MTTEYRDWRPGDGLRCAYSRSAPREIPCGQPIKTAVSIQQPARGAERTVVKALCKNHAPGGVLPSKLTTEARKVAIERLCSERWEEFEKYYREALESLSEGQDLAQPG